MTPAQMNPEAMQKLDLGLKLALRGFEESDEGANPDDSISVNLRFDGDLAPIEALGFESHSVAEDQALGVLRFCDIERIALHPNVVRISAGMEPGLHLEAAVADGRVRASSPATVGAGGDGLWHAVVATGVLTAAPNASGRDVIIAIIDTGIDYTHPAFMSQLTPTKQTRIRRIWDQGLVPGAIAECPPVALLASSDTYGREFTDVQINTALNAGPALPHKDCIGHGTHCAGIAAGGTIFPAGGDASRVGVAPEADIIAVKLLDNPDVVRFRLAAGPGGQVSFTARMHDAIIYCLRTARAMGKPIVVSMSFGNGGEAGDGLDDDARWLDARLDPAQPAGPLNFPTGAIAVKSAGNDGNAAHRQVAKITVPAGGQITVPLEIFDNRVGVNTTWKQCAQRQHSPPVTANFWYRRNFNVVSFALRLPHQTVFSGDMGIGGNLDHSFILRVGPPRVALVAFSPTVFRVVANHDTNPSVPHPDGGTLRRHNFNVAVVPKVSGGTVTYPVGIYEVKIKAPAGTVVYMLCSVAGFAPGRVAMFKVAATMADGSALDPGIDVTPQFSSVDTFGRHVLTVAAYDDTNGVAADPHHHHLATFSSRGPLRDFSDPPGSLPLIASKPDIAAPGVAINSAESADTNSRPLVPTPNWLAGIRFVPKGGTSMSTPFVGGVVALMLDKTLGLTITQVRTALRTAAAARPGVNPAAPPAAHANAYGAGMVDGLASHQNTP